MTCRADHCLGDHSTIRVWSHLPHQAPIFHPLGSWAPLTAPDLWPLTFIQLPAAQVSPTLLEAALPEPCLPGSPSAPTRRLSRMSGPSLLPSVSGEAQPWPLWLTDPSTLIPGMGTFLTHSQLWGTTSLNECKLPRKQGHATLT